MKVAPFGVTMTKQSQQHWVIYRYHVVFLSKVGTKFKYAFGCWNSKLRCKIPLRWEPTRYEPLYHPAYQELAIDCCKKSYTLLYEMAPAYTLMFEKKNHLLNTQMKGPTSLHATENLVAFPLTLKWRDTTFLYIHASVAVRTYYDAWHLYNLLHLYWRSWCSITAVAHYRVSRCINLLVLLGVAIMA